MQAVGQLVELGEPGRYATGQTAVRRDRVDLVHRRLQEVLQRDEVLRGPALGDVVDLGLRAVHDLRDIGALRAGVAVLDDPGTRFDEPAQQRLLRDDAGIEPGIGGRRHRRDQRVQIRCAADPSEQIPPVELRGDRHRIRRLTAAIEIQDRVVDALVVGPVEVRRPEPLEHVGDGVLAQQHPAEHGLFGRLVLRWLATEILGWRWDVHLRMATVVHDSHDASSPPLELVERTFDGAIVTVSRGTDRNNIPDAGTALRRPTLDVAGAVGKPPCL